MIKDRRRCQRYEADFEVDYSLKSDEITLSDKSATRNISMSGVSFDVLKMVKNKKQVMVSIKIPGKAEPISAICELVWRKEQNENGGRRVLGGLKVIKIQPKDRDRLSEYIYQMSNAKNHLKF